MFTGWTKASAIVVNRMALLTRQLGISLSARQAHDFSPISSSPNRAFEHLLVASGGRVCVHARNVPGPWAGNQVRQREGASGIYPRDPHHDAEIGRASCRERVW